MLNQISTKLSQDEYVGNEMKVHIGMQGQPAILLGLVRIEMVQNEVHFAVAMRYQDIAHEIEKLASPPSGIMTHLHLAGGNPPWRQTEYPCRAVGCRG